MLWNSSEETLDAAVRRIRETAPPADAVARSLVVRDALVPVGGPIPASAYCSAAPPPRRSSW